METNFPLKKCSFVVYFMKLSVSRTVGSNQGFSSVRAQSPCLRRVIIIIPALDVKKKFRLLNSGNDATENVVLTEELKIQFSKL
jgi:hypothetical protein